MLNMNSSTQKLIILCGIPFSGKTHFAQHLEKAKNYKRVDLDEIKFELYGTSILDHDIDSVGWDTIYQEMYARIKRYLDHGHTVIHDTGNFSIYERGLINKIALDMNIPFVTIFINTDKEIARKRLIENRKSKKRFNVTSVDFENSVNEMERPTEQENPLTYAPQKYSITEFIELHSI